jgi:hypothetical protein
VLHRFDGGILPALVLLSKSHILSYDSLRDAILFSHEPSIVTVELSSSTLSGYLNTPVSLRSVLEQFLEGCGIPNEELAIEVGIRDLARGLGEDLDDAGARSRIFLLAATSSCSLTSDSSISVSLHFL